MVIKVSKGHMREHKYVTGGVQMVVVTVYTYNETTSLDYFLFLLNAQSLPTGS